MACEVVIFTPRAAEGDRLSGTITYPIYENGDRGSMTFGYDSHRDDEEALMMSGPTVAFHAEGHAEYSAGCANEAAVTYDGTTLHISPRDQVTDRHTLYRTLDDCRQSVAARGVPLPELC
jgi:hypothetical protein